MAGNECSQGFPELKPKLNGAAEKLSGWALGTTEALTCNNVVNEGNKLLANKGLGEVPMLDYGTTTEKKNQYSQLASALDGIATSSEADSSTKMKAAKIASTLRKKASAK